jgi:hypothetical protein
VATKSGKQEIQKNQHGYNAANTRHQLTAALEDIQRLPQNQQACKDVSVAIVEKPHLVRAHQ